MTKQNISEISHNRIFLRFLLARSNTAIAIISSFKGNSLLTRKEGGNHSSAFGEAGIAAFFSFCV